VAAVIKLAVAAVIRVAVAAVIKLAVAAVIRVAVAAVTTANYVPPQSLRPTRRLGEDGVV
jgi:large-conductance mechanosensitive channel